MGTTQRIVPGVTGEPNWADLSRSITHISKTVEKEKELEQKENDQEDTDTEQHATAYATAVAKLTERRKKHLKTVFDSLIRASGGRESVKKGRSRSFGSAGRKSASRLVGFVTGVANHGLEEQLKSIGLGDLTGKRLSDVIDLLLNYSSESSAGMDDTAANKAMLEVLNQLSEQADNDLGKFEELLEDYAEGKGLADLLCRFWGVYIFEHLSQRFQEKIRQTKGEEVSQETFQIIRDDIIGQVEVLNDRRPVATINWQGTEGENQIESIFESIINIICDDH
jgi:hypothetical protein